MRFCQVLRLPVLQRHSSLGVCFRLAQRIHLTTGPSPAQRELLCTEMREVPWISTISSQTQVQPGSMMPLVVPLISIFPQLGSPQMCFRSQMVTLLVPVGCLEQFCPLPQIGQQTVVLWGRISARLPLVCLSQVPQIWLS